MTAHKYDTIKWRYNLYLRNYHTFGSPAVIVISSPSLGLDGCAGCSPVMLRKSRIQSIKNV